MNFSKLYVTFKRKYQLGFCSECYSSSISVKALNIHQYFNISYSNQMPALVEQHGGALKAVFTKFKLCQGWGWGVCVCVACQADDSGPVAFHPPTLRSAKDTDSVFRAKGLRVNQRGEDWRRGRCLTKVLCIRARVLDLPYRSTICSEVTIVKKVPTTHNGSISHHTHY